MNAIAVRIEAFDTAAANIYSANRIAALVYNDLLDALPGHAGMGGNDTLAAQFASGYDDGATETMGALRDLIEACANVGLLLDTTGGNHRRANEASVYDIVALEPDDVLPPEGPVEVGAYSHRSAEGGDNADLPDLWNLIQDHAEGIFWPNADTGTLGEASSTWHAKANTIRGLTSYCDNALEHLADQHSPEIPLARDALRELSTCIEDVADGMQACADECSDYADDIEERREQIQDILQQLAIEAGLSVAAGVALSFVTFGLGAAGGAALATSRILSAVNAIRIVVSAALKYKAIRSLANVTVKIARARSKLQKMANARKARFARWRRKRKWKKIRKKGKRGEDRAGIVKNTERIEAPSGKAKYRIPDELDHADEVIGEVKNVKHLDYTHQLRDFMDYAQRNGYTFRLFVDRRTQLSPELQDLVDSGAIQLIRKRL